MDEGDTWITLDKQAVALTGEELLAICKLIKRRNSAAMVKLNELRSQIEQVESVEDLDKITW